MPLSTSDPTDFAAEQPEREFHRICIRHRAIVGDDLYCREGRHTLRAWGAYDPVRNVVYGGGNPERVVIAEGELGEALSWARYLGKTRPVNRRLGVVGRAYRDLRNRVRGGLEPAPVHFPLGAL